MADDDLTAKLVRDLHETPTIIPAPAKSSTNLALTPGTILAGRYRISGRLGRGGMGEVFRADDLRLGQPVALKFLADRASTDAASIQRLYDEVKLARHVTHPNVCRVHDVIEADGLRFLSMEFVDGEDLASLLRRVGRLPQAKVIEIARHIAAGLSAAHEENVVHRDLKPANIMIDGKGIARIADFGLASVAAEGRGREIAGTPAYMAPEQLEGEPATFQSDLYAFGLILYEMLSGKRVFTGSSSAEVISGRARPIEPLRQVAPDVDPALDDIISRCLAEEPDKRPASARSILMRFPGGDPLAIAVEAGETPSPEMVAAATRRGDLSWTAAALLSITALALLITAAWMAEHFRLYRLARRSPDALSDRARTVAEDLGYQPRSTSWMFVPDRAELRHKWGAPLGPFLRQPAYLQFKWRAGESPLLASGAARMKTTLVLLDPGRITANDPPLTQRGMVDVTTNRDGKLIELAGIPSSPASAGELSKEWDELFTLASLNRQEFVATTPLDTPPVPSDRTLAWIDSGSRRVEAATLRGRVSWFRSEPAEVAPPPKRTISQIIEEIFTVVIMLTSTFVAVILCRRNRRMQRGDLRGAFRTSLFVFIALMLFWMFSSDHALILRHELEMFALAVGLAASSAIILWIYYLAMEPYVRRRWPETLIGWIRLLEGRFKDPLVGRDLLIGVIAGALETIIVMSDPALDFARGLVPHYGQGGIEMLMSGRQTFGTIFMTTVDAIGTSLGLLFLIMLLRNANRRFALILLLLLLAPGGVIQMIAGAILAVVIWRFGLLAAATAGTICGIFVECSIGIDPDTWYFGQSLAILLAIAALTLVAAYISTAGKPLLASLETS
ncbi:MAG TPA: serine/threonine-protein kinase [Thermoanaerobaculia bacterium]|nr:serine/threonine-protein kinase [Thermoanaerobaculia bacterium]